MATGNGGTPHIRAGRVAGGHFVVHGLDAAAGFRGRIGIRGAMLETGASDGGDGRWVLPQGWEIEDGLETVGWRGSASASIREQVTRACTLGADMYFDGPTFLGHPDALPLANLGARMIMPDESTPVPLGGSACGGRLWVVPGHTMLSQVRPVVDKVGGGLASAFRVHAARMCVASDEAFAAMWADEGEGAFGTPVWWDASGRPDTEFVGAPIRVAELLPEQHRVATRFGFLPEQGTTSWSVRRCDDAGPLFRACLIPGVLPMRFVSAAAAYRQDRLKWMLTTRPYDLRYVKNAGKVTPVRPLDRISRDFLDAGGVQNPHNNMRPMIPAYTPVEKLVGIPWVAGLPEPRELRAAWDSLDMLGVLTDDDLRTMTFTGDVTDIHLADADEDRKDTFRDMGGIYDRSLGGWVILAGSKAMPFYSSGWVRGLPPRETVAAAWFVMRQSGLLAGAKPARLTDGPVDDISMPGPSARTAAPLPKTAAVRHVGATMRVVSDDDVAAYAVTEDEGRSKKNGTAKAAMRRIGGELPLMGTCDPELVGTALLMEFPWMGSAIAEITRMLALRAMSGAGFVRFRPFLIVGGAGVGKTRFLRRVLELSGLPYNVLSCSNETDSIGFSGSSGSFQDPQPSLVVRTMAQFRVANPAIIADEIEKTGANHNGSIHAALLPLLEQETASRFTDKLLDVGVDVSQVSWLMTANSLEGLSEPFLSRVSVVTAGDPQPEDLDAIIRAVVADVSKQNGIPVGTLPPLPDNVMANIRRRFADTRSIRRVVRAVSDHYGNAAAPMSVMNGLRRTVTSPKFERLVATHEAGHAVLSLFGDVRSEISLATIDPEGEEAACGAGGYVLPVRDPVPVRSLRTMTARLAMLMAGMEAERLVGGDEEMSEGASADIRAAQELAWRITVNLGLTGLGIVSVGSDFKPISSDMADKVSETCAKLLSDAAAKAKSVLTARRQELHLISAALIERRTLTGEDIEVVLGGRQAEVGTPDMRHVPAPLRSDGREEGGVSRAA